MIVHRDHKALPSVDDPCLYEIRPLRIHLDDDIRRLNVELSRLCDIRCKKGRLLPSVLLIVPVKVLHLLRRDAALLEDLLHVCLVQLERLRLFLVLLDQIVERLVDIADRLIVSFLSQRILDDHLECLLLGVRGHRHLGAQELADHLRLEVFGFLRIIKYAVQICAPVIERREQKSLVRHIHDPVPDTVLNTVVLRVVAQSRLGQRYRTEAHEQIFIHLVGGVEHLQVIRRFPRDVVHGMDEDDIVILAVLICSDHFVIELFEEHIVLKLAISKFQKKLLRSSRHLRVQRELHIQHVFPHCAGQCFFENIKIFECFLLRQGEKRIL